MNLNINDFPKDLSDVDAKWIDNKAYKEAEEYARNIKTNQLRNVFSHINLIKINLRNNLIDLEGLKEALILLKPKLAYAKGRQKAVKPFQELMFKAIDAVVDSKDTKKAAENFFALVEAIIAYHKFHGGRES